MLGLFGEHSGPRRTVTSFFSAWKWRRHCSRLLIIRFQKWLWKLDFRIKLHSAGLSRRSLGPRRDIGKGKPCIALRSSRIQSSPHESLKPVCSSSPGDKPTGAALTPLVRSGPFCRLLSRGRDLPCPGSGSEQEIKEIVRFAKRVLRFLATTVRRLLAHEDDEQLCQTVRA